MNITKEIKTLLETRRVTTYQGAAAESGLKEGVSAAVEELPLQN
jgi:hypothetical protein